ncbi:MAG TPA: hypothetical protein PKD19_04285 [Candidatus Saccharibacteria bacterium]|jgi:hypothetical protein|nr:hypothetical protein [Candidatus Saccharibacteria bacterium]HMR38716.1 hypothetical protein [Candidatus Saccharibacteria bacterium]
MNKFIVSSLNKWYQETDTRIKLQHAYMALAIVGIIVAGLVGLVRYEVGQTLVTISFVCLGVFVFNAIAWALLNGLVLIRLGNNTKPKATTKKK